MNITTVFLDWDYTLVDFFKSEENAFRATYQSFGLSFDPAVYKRYSQINDECWKMLERQEIVKQRVYLLRYERLFAEYGLSLDPVEFNARYLPNLSEQTPLFDGARELCAYLHGRFRVYVTTNGDANGQKKRLAKSGLGPYVDGLFVSEAVGIGKPNREYWEYVFDHIGEKDPDKMIVIGDSQTSDMQSGINMGMHTLWLNLFNETPKHPYDFIVSKTGEIADVIRGNI